MVLRFFDLQKIHKYKDMAIKIIRDVLYAVLSFVLVYVCPISQKINYTF